MGKVVLVFAITTYYHPNLSISLYRIVELNVSSLFPYWFWLHKVEGSLGTLPSAAQFEQIRQEKSWLWKNSFGAYKGTIFEALWASQGRSFTAKLLYFAALIVILIRQFGPTRSTHWYKSVKIVQKSKFGKIRIWQDSKLAKIQIFGKIEIWQNSILAKF